MKVWVCLLEKKNIVVYASKSAILKEAAWFILCGSSSFFISALWLLEKMHLKSPVYVLLRQWGSKYDFWKFF